MATATPVAPGAPDIKNNRAFVLGSLSVGHGLSHMFDQGFPLLITEIAAAMGLGTLQTAAIFAVRQGGSSATSLGGGPFIDHLKSYWGLILTACMLGHAVTFAAIGGSPNLCAPRGGRILPVHSRIPVAPPVRSGYLATFP